MVITEYKNGNADIKLYDDGTRVIEYDDVLNLDTPLNIDIKVNSQCDFGMNPKTGKAFCDFCHESATTNGKECDYELLKDKLNNLPKGIELAIGGNNITPNLYDFISWCYNMGYIVNLTVNQGHLKRDLIMLNKLIDNGLIKGLGVSYRSALKFSVPEEILNYEHTVFHVICGIDSFSNVASLINNGVNKILLLGEKNFGYNKGRVDLTTRKHKEWYWWVHKLFSMFNVVSFDNLALEQLNIKRFFTNNNWEVFNQGEQSCFVDSVNGYFAPSSRSDDKTNWNTTTIKNYFKTYKN
jgi:hypothetical protein